MTDATRVPSGEAGQASPREAHRVGVGAADDDADALTGARLIAAREHGRGSGRAARLGDDAQPLPQRALGGPDGVVAHEHDLVDMLLGDREHPLADALRRQRVGGDAAGRRVDRAARRAALGERRRRVRLDADDARRVPANHAAMPPINPPPPTATSSVSSVRRLLVELQPERALAEQRLDLVVGMDGSAPARAAHASLAASASA